MSFLLLLLAVLPTSLSEQTPCGSLITYRQLDDLLASAPKCLQSGCQLPKDLTSSPSNIPLSLSSACPPPSPCAPFWTLLLQSSHQDWCTACAQLPPDDDDIACRIPGWPILNGTSLCSASPHTWLFSNNIDNHNDSQAVEGCCSLANEPFALAAWTGRICNGSEWREGFGYFGGMARQDWAEWMQSWNWTVHYQPQPLNETGWEATGSQDNGNGNGSLVPTGVPVCDSARAMEVAFLVDNFVSAGWAALELFGYWVCCICAWGVVMKEVGPWQRSIAGGWVTGGLYLVSNFATAVLWERTQGYRGISTGYVGLLLCARPSVLGFFCLVSIWGREKAERSMGLPREAGKVGPEPWFERERVKRWRRVAGGWLRKYFSFGPEAQDPDVTDDDLKDGRETAKQLLTGFALNIGVSELALQVSSVYSTWKTAIVGGKRGFYSPGALLPFYGGSAAARMYGGALLHCIFLFPSTLSLIAIAWSHAEEQEYTRLRRIFFAEERREHSLRDFYEKPPGSASTEDGRAKNRAMFQMQRALESSVFGTARPRLWKRTWIRIKEWLTRCFGRLRHGRNQYRAAPVSRGWAPAERGFISAMFHKALIGAMITVTAPLNRLVESIPQSSRHTDPENAKNHATRTSRLCSLPRRLARRCLSFRLVRVRIANSLRWAQGQQEAQNLRIREAEQGPSRDRFREILERLAQNRTVADKRDQNSLLPSARGAILFITTVFVVINYISQWLFWSGYVETAGERYVAAHCRTP